MGLIIENDKKIEPHHIVDAVPFCFCLRYNRHSWTIVYFFRSAISLSSFRASANREEDAVGLPFSRLRL